MSTYSKEYVKQTRHKPLRKCHVSDVRSSTVSNRPCSPDLQPLAEAQAYERQAVVGLYKLTPPDP